MSALVAPIEPWIPETASDREWVVLATICPQATVTIGRYVQQLSTFLAPRSVGWPTPRCASWSAGWRPRPT